MRRRDFLKGFSVLALGGIPDEAEARGLEESVCTNSRERSIRALKEACGTKIIQDPEARMTLLEGLHSSAEFAGLAKYVDTTTKEKGLMRFLYPGSGSHIAPFYMAAKLFDKGEIESADFTFTDIDECKQMELEQNLSNLPRVDPHFIFHSDKTQFNLDRGGGDGVEISYYLEYKGHPIQLRFCLNRSGNAFYGGADFTSSDVFIIHDVGGYGVQDTLDLLSEYFESQFVSNTSAPSTIILEDLTRAAYPKRAFDLELLGDIYHGRNAYGHRTHEHTTLDHFSRAQACRVRGGYAGSSYAPHPDDLDQWENEGLAPAKYMTLSTETGEASGNGAVLLPHPSILKLSPRLTALLIDIGLAANNEDFYNFGISVRDRLRTNNSLYYDETPLLFSPSLLKDLFDKGDKIISILEEINPKLAQGLVVRMLQILIKCNASIIPQYIKENHSDNSEAGFKKVVDFFDSVTSYLSSSELSKLKKYLSATKKYLIAQQNSYLLWQKQDALSAVRRGDFDAWKEGLRLTSEDREKIFNKLYSYGNDLFESIKS